LACEQKNGGISRDGHKVMINAEMGFRTAADKVFSQDIFVLLLSLQVNVKTKCHSAQNKHGIQTKPNAIRKLSNHLKPCAAAYTSTTMSKASFSSYF
jgi:hypothetical protein